LATAPEVNGGAATKVEELGNELSLEFATIFQLGKQLIEPILELGASKNAKEHSSKERSDQTYAYVGEYEFDNALVAAVASYADHLSGCRVNLIPGELVGSVQNHRPLR
jgi:predicted porin